MLDVTSEQVYNPIKVVYLQWAEDISGMGRSGHSIPVKATRWAPPHRCPHPWQPEEAAAATALVIETLADK